MSVTLNQPPDVLIKQFRVLKSRKDIARMLDVSLSTYTYFVCHLKDDKKYVSFTVPKKNGKSRNILAPSPGLKCIQKKLNQVLQCLYEPKESTNGFIAGRNIVRNARVHCKKRYVLNIDIENFFESVHFGRIRGMFMAHPYSLSETVARDLANICCCYKRLPQGAPTSPIISNMICSRMDAQLQYFAHSLHCMYSRYADDITFSTSTREIHHQLVKEVSKIEGKQKVVLGEELQNIIQQNTFNINHDKTRLQLTNQRQSVTGLITNKIPNIKRKFVRQIRAMLHSWEKFGYDNAETELYCKYDKNRLPLKRLPFFKDVLRGKIEFLGMVRGKDNPMYYFFDYHYDKLAVRDGKTKEVVSAKIRYDAFICHASEDKKAFVLKLAHNLIRKGHSIWFDEFELKTGDSIRRKIDEGLKHSRYGIVIFSKAFFNKNWPQYELDGLVETEMSDSKKRILPIWYRIEKDDMLRYSPSLAGKKAIKIPERTIEEAVNQLSKDLKQDK